MTALAQNAVICHSRLARKKAIMAGIPEASMPPVRLAFTALKCWSSA